MLFDTEFTKAPPRAGSKPLHIAVHSKRANIIKLLTTNSADLNTQDKVGYTPLYYADQEDIVKVLLECGTEINVCDGAGDTPLLAAARDGHSAAPEALLANGADFNDRSVSGLTAMWLIPLKDPEILNPLMQGGADITNTRDAEGRTLLYMAARKATSRFVLGHLHRGGISSRATSRAGLLFSIRYLEPAIPLLNSY
ncbi:ankyrin repeat-containing domain protein [Achaetomium macrosporum]|uniref:Ankyrin repeat-containing domain protein n=1 Tax=Achaetomium macrosporum TaxID=79813 RepID=A0AAN7H8N2_9PEZI|nr:ankyrin repeat-containing domain protein [Achaetomium macrosporum]